MFLVGLISWWYGDGWRLQWGSVSRRFTRTVDFFSITQLLATLFSPFRQIAAGGTNNNAGVAALRALGDQLISRCIGSIVRFMTIIAGVIAIVLQAVYESVIMLVWWVVPVLPIAGLVMFAIGWVPLWR